MGTKKKKTKKKPKKYLLELTLKSAIFWSLGLCFLLVWIFTLGILVGRGHVSYGIMKDKLAEVRDADSKKEPSDSSLTKKSDPDPKLAFYEELSSKKETATQKSRPSVKKRVPDTVSNKKSGEKPKNSSINKANVPQRYVLQIGSFKAKSKAVTLVDRLMDRGYPTYYSSVRVNGKTRYRVKCGPFKTETKADNFKKVMAKKENIHGFVTRVEK